MKTLREVPLAYVTAIRFFKLTYGASLAAWLVDSFIHSLINW